MSTAAEINVERPDEIIGVSHLDVAGFAVEYRRLAVFFKTATPVLRVQVEALAAASFKQPLTDRMKVQMAGRDGAQASAALVEAADGAREFSDQMAKLASLFMAHGAKPCAEHGAKAFAPTINGRAPSAQRAPFSEPIGLGAIENAGENETGNCDPTAD